MIWANPGPLPAQFLGLAWDIYAANWVNRGAYGGPWFPYPAVATEGDLDRGSSGAYHVWLANQYWDGSCWFCPYPWTGIQYSGLPHTPLDVSVEDIHYPRRVQLHWKPENYGTWLWEIIVYRVGVGFIPVQGPSGNALWHFVDYGGVGYTHGQADFLTGTAYFTLPADGNYWFLIRGAGWLPPYDPPTTGDFAAAFVSVGGS
ncbi:MAG: hypothetical protein NTW86_25035 [Candidatus Sumerlaeota bacterium]|nr:hypothetical protein [Candidatus Sumerlaeota bacterium]